MDYDTYHTDFYTDVRQAIVNQNITIDGDQVDVLASYNDENDSAPVITLNPIEPSEVDDKFDGSNDDKQITVNQAIYCIGQNTLDVEQMTEQVKAALPERVNDFVRDTVDVTYTFSNSAEQKLHSTTISVSYRYK